MFFTEIFFAVFYAGLFGVYYDAARKMKKSVLSSVFEGIMSPAKFALTLILITQGILYYMGQFRIVVKPGEEIEDDGPRIH